MAETTEEGWDIAAVILRSRIAEFVLDAQPGLVRAGFATGGFDRILAIYPTKAKALASLDC